MTDERRHNGNHTQGPRRGVYLSTPKTSPSFVAKVAQLLVDKGVQTNVYTTGQAEAFQDYENCMIGTSAPVRLLPRGSRRSITPSFFRSRWQLARADVVIADHPGMLDFAARRVWRRGTRLVYLPFEYYADLSYGTVADKQRWAAIENRCGSRVDAWVINSDTMVELYRERRLATDAMHVVYTAALKRGAAATAAPLRTQLGIAPQDVIVLYQGQIHERRGIWDVVRAIQLLPQRVHFVTIGFGNNDALRAHVLQLGLERRIHVLEAVAHKDLLSYTRVADIGLIPVRPVCESYRHCCPAKLFEYLAAGLPMVVSDLPQLSWFVRTHGVGEVCDAAHPADLARALARLVNDSDYRKSCAENALKIHHSEACWEVQGEKLWNILHGSRNAYDACESTS